MMESGRTPEKADARPRLLAVLDIMPIPFSMPLLGS
jgi:hypothetical protein